MTRSRPLLVLALAIGLAVLAVPAEATHNNRGTIKVHDNETENPDVRNVPHVSCDFWIEGFFLGDDSGWLAFFAWPPTGDMSSVTPTGDGLDWSADAGNVSGEFHFLSGPFHLPPGHYRVDVFTDDGHPGSDEGQFAKSKTFWVDPCDQPDANPPCPAIVGVTATTQDGAPIITLTWSAVANASSYVVYRAVEGAEFEMLDVTTDTTFTDAEVEVGVTYEYYVTAVVGDLESEQCEIVEATAVPFFGGMTLGALALVGALAAYVVLRRRG